MDLITVADLETALGRSLTPEETTDANYFISLVSNYIITYTGVSFTQETDTIRMKADYYGRIELPGGPVVEVTDVSYHYGSEVFGWQWDGLDEVYGLCPSVVVDITYTFGYSAVPNDIKTVALDVTKRLFESPSGQETGPLTRYRVGDVEESYRAVDVGSLSGLFNDLDKLILDQYRGSMTTWFLGFAQPDNISAIPSGPDALSE